MASKPKRDYPATDRLGTMKDGLKWKWKWPKWVYSDSHHWHGGPGYQTASAEKTTVYPHSKITIMLECIRWCGDGGYYYEAGIRISGNRVVSSHVPFEKGYKSRLDAQLAAERLVLQLKRAL